MVSIVIYCMESTVCIAVLFMVYKLLLKNLTFFTWRRCYLLFVVIISILLPTFSLEINKTQVNEFIFYSNDIIGSFENQLIDIGNQDTSDQLLPTTSWGIIIGTGIALGLLLYLSIVAWKFTLLFKKILSAISIPKNAIIRRGFGYSVVSSDQISKPYSFWKTIYLPASTTLSKEEKAIVIAHEYTHVRQFHSIDLIFLEIIKIIFWANPIYNFIRHELELLHEYIADAAVNENRKETKSYAKILIKLSTSNTLSLTNNFSKIQIKNRIIMLNQKNSNQLQKFKFIVALPVLCILFLSFSTAPVSQPDFISYQKNIAAFKSIVPDLFDNNETPDAWPIGSEYRKITSGFGMRKDPFIRTKKFHRGIDILAPMGTPVTAAGDGEIIMAVSHEGGYGKHVKIVHGDFTTLYSHLNRYIVGKGDVVKQGQIIGYVGTSGRSVHPHLHFEIHKNRKPMDPKELLKLH